MKIAIIGGGLTGLSLAHVLHKNTHEVVLIEAKETLGGRFRGGDTSELGFVSPSDSALQSLEWLKAVSPLGFSWREEDHSPLVFDHSEWRPFLGFGDFPSTVVNELSFFNQSKQWFVEPGLDQMTRALIEQLPIEARTMSEVTGFECEGGRVTAAILNGQERLAADIFIFSPSPHLLNDLTPMEALKPASRTRLAKQTAWTAVTVMLQHKEPIETTPAMRFVLGTGKEFEPIVGRVWPTHSIWLNLVSQEQQEDLEHVGNCVRHINRTLKRVWPELLDGQTEAKIRVRPQAFGKLDLKLKNGAFPELSNLLLADGRLSDVPGELGTAAIAQQLSALFVAQPQNSVLIDTEQF